METHAASGDTGPFRGFRKRIPLELGRDDLDLLRAHQAEYGSMRATLLAGLAALNRLAAAERERDEARAELEAASVRAELAEASFAKASAGAARAKGEASKAKQSTTKIERAWQDALDHAQHDIHQLTQQLDEAHEARRLIEAEWDAALAREFDQLRCPRCQRFAPAEEWATHPATDGGELVYHQPCGLHQDGLLTPSSVLGYRRG